MSHGWACVDPLKHHNPIGQELFHRDLKAAKERIAHYQRELAANFARPSTNEWFSILKTLQTKIICSKYGLDVHAVRGLGSVVNAPSSYALQDDRRAIRNEWIDPIEQERQRQAELAREQQHLILDPFWRLRKRRTLLYAWINKMLLSLVIPKEVPKDLDVMPGPEDHGEDQVELYWNRAKKFIQEFNAPNAVDSTIILFFKQQLALDQYLEGELKKNILS